MLNTVVNSVLSILVSGIIGYLIGLIRNYKKKIKDKEEESAMLKEALMSMLYTNLTNTFYVYEQQKKIPDYVYRNWKKSCDIYEKLADEDELLTALADKMKKWDFVKTDVLG